MKRIIVTSALPFANGHLHIGHIAGCYLPADIYVKYQQLKQRDVIHICGTDEHGVLIEMKSIKEQTTPQAIVDKYYPSIKASLTQMGIEYTNFSRTTKEIHYKNAQNFFLKLYKNGYLTPETTEELYCDKCKHFLPERFVEGICPYCGNIEARGDQCEKCGRWLEPTMLKNPRCQVCGTTPITRTTKHWCLRLDLLQPQIERWLETKTEWRENVTRFVKQWLKEGLSPRPVTRDIAWGVPVPLNEANNKVIYVWFENLIGYISATQEWSPEHWNDYWGQKDTELVHFIAKDNIVFHAINWPAMLMGHGDYILPTQIPANEFLNIEGKKISTSRNWAIWLPEYLETFDPDPLRYVLTMNAPERGDVDFTWDDFLAKNNSELSDILGNLVHRTLRFIQNYLDSKIPYPASYTTEDEQLLKKIELTRDKVGAHIERFEFKSGLKEIMALVKEGNRYFDYNKPWEQNNRTNTVIYVSTTLIANLAILLYPFLPFASKSIREMLNLQVEAEPKPKSSGGNDLKDFAWDIIGKFKLPGGVSIKPPKVLFKKIDKSKIETEKQKLSPTNPTNSTNLTNSTKTLTPITDNRNQVTYEDFKKLDLRIAEILEAERIEGTKKLIKLKISIGDEKRQVVAGIGEAYSPQELIGKKIVVVANLEPRTIHGEQSEAMLLATTFGDKLSLIIPDQDIPAGSIIS